MTTICKFCKKEFIFTGNIIKHQKTAKYRIKVQQEFPGNELVKNISFSCKYCNKYFTSKYHMNNNIDISDNSNKLIIENVKKNYLKEINNLNLQILDKK